MPHFVTALQRLIPPLLVVILLVLGLTNPAMALTDTLEENAPERCLSVDQEGHHTAMNGFSNHDAGDDSSDLEQLLRPPSGILLPAFNIGQDISPPQALLPQPAAPPLLRPPISRL